MKTLEKDRKRRYETANDLATDVRRYLNDEPVLACPPSVAYRLHKLVRRNKGLVLAASLICVALVGGIISTTWGMIRATQAEADTKREATQKEQALQQKEAALTAVSISEQNAKRKQQLALHAQKEAQESFQEAIAAVDQLLTRVSEERLADVPHMEPLRRALLQDAMKFYRRFLEKKSDDPDMQFETAKASQRLADIHQMFRDSKEAEKSYRRSIAILRDLAARFPGKPSYRHELAVTYNAFSEVLRAQLRLDEPEQFLRQAVDFELALLAEQPAAPSYRRTLGETYSMLGWILRHKSGSLGYTATPRSPSASEEATKFLSEAVAVYGKLVAEFPKVAEYRYGLALANERLGMHLRDAGLHRREEGQGPLQQAIDLFAALVEEFPSSFAYRDRLATAQGSLAMLFEITDRAKLSEDCFLAAYGVHKKLTLDYPHARAHAGNFATTCHRLALFASKRGDFIPALVYYEEALVQAQRRLELNPDYAYGRWLLCDVCSSFAWLLSTCPDPKLRDADRALELAHKAVAVESEAGRKLKYLRVLPLRSLGVANYRVGNLKAAVAALDKSRELNKAADAVDCLFLAMAHWKLDQREQARKSYEQAVQWMEKNGPENEELRRFRAEANELLEPKKK